ncbi:MAG: T9SS type A sorting domain-containing protein [Candidatus Delongbacteria bacterium]|nr:T9SS type A sorting domain-containing protein [Candidatus Delongbacteria bacterium]
MRNSLSFIITMLFATSLWGNWVELPENSDRDLFNYTPVRTDLTEISFALDGYFLEEIWADGQVFQRISYRNEGEFIEAGRPALPRFTRLIALPDEGVVSIQVTGQTAATIGGLNIYPSQELQSESQRRAPGLIIDEEFYSNGAPFPDSAINLGEPALMRDLRVVAVTVNPFRFDPQTGELRVISNLELEVTTSGSGGENPLRTDRAVSRSFQSTYRSTVLNHAILNNRDQEYQQPCYLFIYPDNQTVLTNLQPLLDWKRQIGFEVHLASTAETGSSSTSIKNYIQTAFDSWPNPPEFICLVGDAEGSYSLPTAHLDGGEGDHYYVRLEGNDILADAFIGRLTFDSITQLQTIVNKIMHYEREPYLDQTDWYDRALIVGDPNSSGSSVVDTKRQTADMIHYNTPNIACTEVYNGSWVYQMSSNINSGVSYFNYRGFYGMSGWDNNDINSLNNGFMLPVAVFLTCDVGSFASSWGEARSEVFLRVGTPTLPKGAIATIATSTSSTHTCYNNCVDLGIFGGIFNDGIHHLGGALNSGKMHLYLSYPQNPANAVYQFSYWNNLMGDPGMAIWTGIPQPLLVAYDTQVPSGSNYLEVLVADGTGTPLPQAWVTISRDDDELFATGLTDASGLIALPLDTNVEGEVHLVVTRHNFQPHLGGFTLAQAAQFVSIDTFTIDDDNSGESSGNSDGSVNPGEQIELNLSLRNHGSNMVDGVTASISSGNDYVTLDDADEDYGDIPAGTAVYSSDDFGFTVADNALGGMELRFDLLVNDLDDNEWADIQYIYVAGPNLHPVDWEIGGGNGILDPGETANLQVTLRNGGTVAASTVSGLLISQHPRITITDADGYFGEIPAGGEVSNSGDQFEVSASAMTLPGTQIPLELQLTGPNGYEQSVTIILEVGVVTQANPLGPDSYGYCIYDDGDTDYYNAPVYNWIEINPEFGGEGTPLTLYDNGNTGAIADVDINFSFRFYGIDYTTLTICSNGWICPGDTDNRNFMNWYIPGPGGPSPMIAPFWDDLRIAQGGVYYYFDPFEHYFVVEWSNLQNDFSHAEETFQAILYDPLYYPTSTGDSEILFQYQTVNNDDIGQYGGGYVYHGQYATVGIEDQTGTVGLEYTFNNSYPTAARPLQNEMALLVTGYPVLHEGPFLVMGEISIDDSGDDGLIDYGETVELSILLNNHGQESATAVSGVLASTDTLITLTASSSGYNDIPSEGAGENSSPFSFVVDNAIPDGHLIPFVLVVNSAEESWEFNFSLLANAPLIDFTSHFVDDGDNNILDPGETADILVSFTNRGGAAAYNATALIASTDEYLTLNSTTDEFDALLSGETHTAIYNITADPSAPVGHICLVDWTMTADLAYEASGVIPVPIAQTTVWMEEDFNSWLPTGWTVTSSTGQVNWMSSNSDQAGGTAPEARFTWTTQTVALQRLISPVLNTLGHASLELEFKHMIDHYSGGYQLRLETTGDGNLWHTAHSWPSADMSATTETVIIENDDIGSTTFQVAWVFEGDSYNIDNWNIDEIRLGAEGYGFIRGNVLLNGGEGVVEEVQLLAGGHQTHPDVAGDYILQVPVGTYDLEATLEGYITATVPDVEVLFNETVIVDIELEPLEGVAEDAIPQVTELIGNYPNPFNPSTTIAFALANPAANSEIAIYNITGQKVTSLLNRALPAGYHQVVWPSTNSSNQPVASGIYFYQLKVDAELIATHRMVLIR